MLFRKFSTYLEHWRLAETKPALLAHYLVMFFRNEHLLDAATEKLRRTADGQNPR